MLRQLVLWAGVLTALVVLAVLIVILVELGTLLHTSPDQTGISGLECQRGAVDSVYTDQKTDDAGNPVSCKPGHQRTEQSDSEKRLVKYGIVVSSLIGFMFICVAIHVYLKPKKHKHDYSILLEDDTNSTMNAIIERPNLWYVALLGKN